MARALDLSPEKRFPSCVALLEALDRAGTRAGGSQSRQRRGRPVGSSRVMAELMAEAAGTAVMLDPDTWLTGPEGDAILRSRFAASLPGINTAHAFEGFRKHWHGQVMRGGKDSLTLLIGMPTQFWKRLFGRPPGLIVDLHWVRARPPAVPLPEITVHIRASDKGIRSQVSLLRQIGPVLLESLRAHLPGASRTPAAGTPSCGPAPSRHRFLLPDGHVTDTIMAHGKDVSLTGMGLYMPCVVPGSEIQLSVIPPPGQRRCT